MSYNKQLNLYSSHSRLQAPVNSNNSSKNSDILKQTAKFSTKPIFPDLASSKSMTTLSSTSIPQKRVRLRDYLFIAETSSTRNNERRKQMKSALPEKTQISPKLSLLKNSSKYEISNEELYKIVRKEILNQCKGITESLLSKMKCLQQQNESTAKNQELLMLYDIQRIITDRIKPAVKQINDMYIHRQQNIVQQVLVLAKQLRGEQISQKQQRTKIRKQNTNKFSQFLGTKN